MKWTWYISLIFMLACGQDSEPKVKTTAINQYADIIRNPLSAQGNVDSTQVAKMTFEEVLFDFDTIPEGTQINHVFRFTNTGKKPLLIQDARSTCGCTIAKFTKDVVNPGQSGMIKATFNSNGKRFYQDKPITIYANTLPQKTIVRLRGFVRPKTANQK